MKVFKGIVTSVKMKDTVVVEVSRRTPHPLYKKLLKRSSKFKVSAPSHNLSVGETISFVETRPIAKTVHFKLMEGKKTPVAVEAVNPEATSQKVSSSQRRAKK